MRSLCNVTTGQVVATRARVAEGFVDRVFGFLNRKHIDLEEALWLPRCASIHTMGMREAIDVLFLDREDRVVRVLCNVPSNRLAVFCRGATSVIELGAGALQRSDVLIGDRFSLE